MVHCGTPMWAIEWERKAKELKFEVLNKKVLADDALEREKREEKEIIFVGQMLTAFLIVQNYKGRKSWKMMDPVI